MAEKSFISRKLCAGGKLPRDALGSGMINEVWLRTKVLCLNRSCPALMPTDPMFDEI